MFLSKNVGRVAQLSVYKIFQQLNKTARATSSNFVNLGLNKSYSNAVCSHTQNQVLKISNFQKFYRFQSTLNSDQTSLTAQGTADLNGERRNFLAIFPDLVRDLAEIMKQSNEETSKWLIKVLECNLAGGKMNRGLTTVISYKILEKPETLTPENVRLANVLGWCVEFLQSYFLMIDDIMDGSMLRRGAPCWYRQPDVGLMAVNDALLVHISVYMLLKKHFHDKPYYKNVLELFNEITWKTATGQYLDITSKKGDKSDLSLFNMERYNAIVKFKTSYYTYVLPTGLAMLMCGIDDPETHRQAKSIFHQIGQLFQIQDDFIDCFRNPTVTGKIGTDIKEGKCTWLSAVALQRANAAQKLIMEEYYGSPDPKHAAKIRALYEKLDIPHTFAVYEETSYNLIKTQIQQITTGVPHTIFSPLLEKIYKRNK